MNTTGKLTKNFTLEEMACKKDKSLVLTPEVVAHAQRLQLFRDWFNRGMKVNSWYRTAAYNKEIGGVSNSQHVLGIATDIALPDEFKGFTATRKAEFVKNCRSKWHELCNGNGGFGIYDSFMHMDSRSVKSDFDYRKNKNY